MPSVRFILHCTGKKQYTKQSVHVHQLLGCPHFAHFAICPGTLRVFFASGLLQCKMRLQISGVKKTNNGSVFELSGVAFRLVPLYGGLLVRHNAMRRSAYYNRLRRPASFVRSLVGVGVDRIPRERFDLESPNFTGTSMPTYPTATPYITSLVVTVGRFREKKLSKMPIPAASGGISREQFKITRFHTLIGDHRPHKSGH